jgi:urease accessory protein
MRRAVTVSAAGDWPQGERLDAITLDYDERHRRRRRYVCDGGLEILLDLPEATVLRHGDGLRLEDGGYVEVRAAAENLIEIRANSPALLTRLAWHLGNRHLPADVDGGRILIRDDHVIVDMLRRLGATVRPVRAPFNPEGGAYGQHNHDHGHPHRHSHGNGPDHHQDHHHHDH